jgi:hypothetical protein
MKVRWAKEPDFLARCGARCSMRSKNDGGKLASSRLRVSKCLLSKSNSFSSSFTFYSIALKNKHKLMTSSRTSSVLIPLSATGRRVVINTWQS